MQIAVIGTGNMGSGLASIFAKANHEVIIGSRDLAIDAGPISNSRFIEPIGEMNIHFGYFLGWGPVSAPCWPRA